jgi:hypothetical protein
VRDPAGNRIAFGMIMQAMEFHAVVKPCCSPFRASDPEE